MGRPIVITACIWVTAAFLAFQVQPIGIPLAMIIIAAVLLPVLWRLQFPYKKIASVILLLFISFGYNQWFDARNQTMLDDHWHEREAELRGTLLSPVSVDGDQASFTIRVRTIEKQEDGNRNNGTSPPEHLDEIMQVFIRLSNRLEQERALHWSRGDEAVLRGTVRLPSTARNFAAFDYQNYLKYQHIHWQVSVKGGENVQIERLQAWKFSRILQWNDVFREKLGSILEQAFPEDQAGFMKGMLVGLRSDLDPEQFQQFSQLGLTHILAISGLHVGIFAGIILALLRWAGLPKETSLTVAMVLMPLYILVTGSAPSVVRAGIMAMAGLYLARKKLLKESLNLVCAVGLGMLLWNPYYLVNISFQLSFLVTIGLILGVPRFNLLLPQRFPALSGALSVTLVAQAASFPLSIYYFNQFSLLSWLANLLIIPVFSLAVIPLGTAVLVLGSLSQPLASIPAWAASRLNDFCFWMVDIMGRWDALHLIFPSPPLWWIVLYYLMIGMLLVMIVRRKMAAEEEATAPPAAYGLPLLYKGKGRRNWGSAAMLLMLAALLFHGYEPDWWQRQGAVHFLDVGQGDAIFIRTPDRYNVLIDGGGTFRFRQPGDEWKERTSPYEVGNKLIVPLLKKRGVHQIDWLIISHGDFDHIGGLQAVLEQLPVKNILFNGTMKDNESSKKLFRTAVQKNIPLYSTEQNRLMEIGRHTVLHFLYPGPLAEGSSVWDDKQNDRSLVFIMELYQARLLFSGDVEKVGETDILYGFKEQAYLENKNDLIVDTSVMTPIDVLKVAHHGSKTSTTQEWLDYWRPAHAVISAGVNNRYGHPSPEVTARLEESGAAIYRTDLQGEIQLLISRKGYRFQTVYP